MIYSPFTLNNYGQVVLSIFVILSSINRKFGFLQLRNKNNNKALTLQEPIVHIFVINFGTYIFHRNRVKKFFGIAISNA